MSDDIRPRSLTAVHNYNLRNQGWPVRFSVSVNEPGTAARFADPVYHTWQSLGYYPSNADIIYRAKSIQAEEAVAIGTYNPWYLERYAYGNTPAPKGHFIVNAFYRNRQSASGISGILDLDRDVEKDRPVSVAFYSGRVWYLMPDGTLYYSQLIRDISDVNKCYQEADPTAEDINELIATDGGVLNILDVGRAYRIVQISNFLVLFADNGIWSIGGNSDGETFSATSQQVKKITEIGAVGAESMIEAEGTIFYWSEGGIYTITQDQVTSQLQAVDISMDTIQTIYLAIPQISRLNVRGFYDKEVKKILWFYNDSEDFDGSNYRYQYTKALIYDLSLNAFYTYSFPQSETMPYIAAVARKLPGTTQSAVVNIVDSNGDLVVTSDSETVTASVTTSTTTDIRVKFLVFKKNDEGKYNYTFAELYSNEMYDWKSLDGEGLNYVSYAETGQDILEDLLSEKEANAVSFFFKRTEKDFVAKNGAVVLSRPSGCLMRAKWDWTDSASSGGWTDPEQIYRFRREYFPIPVGPSPFDYGYDVVQVIENVRGKGKALSIRFESEEGKDFHILGWAIPYVGMMLA